MTLLKLNDTTLSYEVEGEGEPVIVLHGGSESSEHMRPLVDILKARFKVYAVDFRGHGKSAKTDHGFSYEEHMGDITAFCEHMELTDFSVVGFSDGGIVGLGLAMKKSLPLKKLVSISANIEPKGVKESVVNWLRTTTVEQTPPSFLTNYKKHNGSDEGFAQNWEALKSLWLEQPLWTMDLLRQITIPVLYVSADNDTIKLEHTVEMFQNTPNARLLVLPNAKHDVSSMSVEIITDAFHRFL